MQINNQVNLDGFQSIEMQDQGEFANQIKQLKCFINQNRTKFQKIWMVSATVNGGLGELISLVVKAMTQFGLDAKWLTLKIKNPEQFYLFVDKLYYLLLGENVHGVKISQREKQVYEKQNFDFAEEFVNNLSTGDVVFIHDHQPLPIVSKIREKFSKDEVICIWRCHLGSEKKNQYTKAAFDFLEPYISQVNTTIFHTKQYIPQNLLQKSYQVTPSIHPFALKNKVLLDEEVSQILQSAQLLQKVSDTTVLYSQPILIFSPEQNKFIVPTKDEHYDYFARPNILQVANYDVIKGYEPLIDAFVMLKRSPDKYGLTQQAQYFIRKLKLTLAGPGYIITLPKQVHNVYQIQEKIISLQKQLSKDIEMLLLPYTDRKNNSLIVNSIQRTASIVANNSLKQGFGIANLQALWKGKLTICSSACGFRQQVDHLVNGVMIQHPEQSQSVLAGLVQMINTSPQQKEQISKNARQKVKANFLIFKQVWKKLQIILDIKKQNSKQ